MKLKDKLGTSEMKIVSTALPFRKLTSAISIFQLLTYATIDQDEKNTDDILKDAETVLSGLDKIENNALPYLTQETKIEVLHGLYLRAVSKDDPAAILTFCIKKLEGSALLKKREDLKAFHETIQDQLSNIKDQPRRSL